MCDLRIKNLGNIMLFIHTERVFEVQCVCLQASSYCSVPTLRKRKHFYFLFAATTLTFTIDDTSA